MTAPHRRPPSRDEPTKEPSRHRNMLVSGVLHDLRQPLTAMGLLLDVLRERNPDRPVAEREVLDDLAELADRMERYVCACLADRVRRAPLPRRLVALDVWLERLVAPHRMRALRNDVTINVEVAGRVRLLIDDVLLARSVENLLDNAARHARSTVSVTAVMTGDLLQVVVENDGAPADLSALADALGGVGSAPSRHGHGIGLYSTRTLLEARGGALAFRANASMTTFVVSIPCALGADGRGP